LASIALLPQPESTQPEWLSQSIQLIQIGRAKYWNQLAGLADLIGWLVLVPHLNSQIRGLQKLKMHYLEVE
jgi:hypothetical protein